MIPCSLFGVFLVRTGTVSRDASLLEFRINCARSEFCAGSDNPYDGNRKRHCECVPQSRRKVASFCCRRQLRRLVRCRHAGQGDGREFEITSLSCVILSLKLVLCCSPRRLVGDLVERQWMVRPLDFPARSPIGHASP